MTQPSAPDFAADLVRIHRVITRGLEVSIRHSGTPLDPAAVPGFVSYAQTTAWVLHGHHISEDQVAFPFFRQKQIDAPYLLLVAEHGQMQAILNELTPALDRLAGEPGSAESLAVVHRAFIRLAGIWYPHIQREEELMTAQAIAAAISLEEQISLAQQFAQKGQENSGPAYMAVPFVLYNLSPEDRAGMLRMMSPEVTQHLVPVVWKDQWAPMQPFLLDAD